MAWQDLFSAIALVFIIEGLLPFISPASLRKTYKRIADMPDQVVRITGFMSMILGVLLLTFVR
ncbi:MAG: DUF2065 domain-containing protein [Cycloclasticus sp.]|nr:DUF2065 domain-containing protein [Cycloclasticus sp.]